jgi:hypothetical protein
MSRVAHRRSFAGASADMVAVMAAWRAVGFLDPQTGLPEAMLRV